MATGCAIKGFLAKPSSEKPKTKKKRKPTRLSNRVPGRMTGQTQKPKLESQPVIEQPKIVKPKPKIKPTRSFDRVPGRMTGQAKEPQPKPQPASSQLKVIKPEEGFSDVKERRNALQLRKVMEDEEKQLIEQEKAWETPAIFRRKEK